jgi:hypothetical protein
MDVASEQAVRLLEALASAYHRLRKFAYRLYLRNSLKTWSSSVIFSGDPLTNQRGGGPAKTSMRQLPLGVSVTLPDGRAVVWGLHLLWDATHWAIRAGIELESEDDSILLREFPTRTSQTVDGCIAQIEQAVDELVANEEVLLDSRIAARGGADGHEDSK